MASLTEALRQRVQQMMDTVTAGMEPAPRERQRAIDNAEHSRSPHRDGVAILTEEQCSFVQRMVTGAVGNATTGIAVMMHEELQLRDQRITVVQAAQVNADATIAAMGEKLETLETTVNELTRRQDAGGDAVMGNDEAAQAINARIERIEQRSGTEGPVSVRVGNLGWDTDGETLKARCKEVFVAADVKPTEHSDFLAMVNRRLNTGSAVECIFHNGADFTKAAFNVKLLAKKFEGTGDRTVWLDKKKTREDLRPNRMVHRAADSLQQLELLLAEVDRKKIERFPRDGEVRTGQIALGWVGAGGRTWHWTGEASERYASEKLTRIKAYCERE